MRLARRGLRPIDLAGQSAEGDWLREVARRASSLNDRMHRAGTAAGSLSERGNETDPVADARLERWRTLVDPTASGSFERRLAWDGLDLDTARRLMTPPPPQDDQPLPAWALTLDAALREAERPVDPGSVKQGDQAKMPFAPVLMPFVVVARARLAERLGADVEQLSPEARTALEGRLLRRLSRLADRPLFVDFSVQRQRRQSGLSRLIATVQGTVGTQEYDRFVVGLLSGGLRDVFLRYPVLARLTATVTDLWVEATAELLTRLAADAEQLAQTFQAGIPLGRATAVGTATSDPHNEGRSVVDLTFESGLRLVYKPKDAGLEMAFGRLLEWLDRHGLPLPLTAVDVVGRGAYGWSRFVSAQPCSDLEAARRYYLRAGELLGLVYGLAGNDCHYENLVAHGEHPVLIDLETFMHPESRPYEDDAAALAVGARAAASQLFRDSVLSTGLLPSWVTVAEGVAIDLSALGAVGEQRIPSQRSQWAHVNSDAMQLVDQDSVIRPTDNVPMLDGHPLSPADFVDEVVAGLRSMYELLLEHRDELLGPTGPLAELGTQRVRFVPRNTRSYALALDRARRRDHLVDGAAFSVELDVLSRPLVSTSSPNLLWPLHRAEQEMLERLDIPLFTTYPASPDLVLPGGGVVPDAFATSGLELKTRRLRNLSPADLDRQVGYTRASFSTRTATDSRSVRPPGKEPDPEPPWSATSVLSSAELVEVARGLADELRVAAVRGSGGGMAWIGVGFVPQVDRYQLQPTGYDLYNGGAGTALFLATLAAVTEDDPLRADALAAVQEVADQARARPTALVRGLGIGGAAGAGSIVYALTRIARLLQEDALVEAASSLAAAVTPEAVAADGDLDVVAGSAGAILGLLAVYDATGDPDLLERASWCGTHLVQTQLTDGPQRGAWDGLLTGLAGFSHGAAGIAFALSRLVARTGDERLRDAMRAAVDYETRVFVPEEGNWPDLRPDPLALPDDRPAFPSQWCHGATGIGLARLGGLAALDTPDARGDIDRAVETTLRAGLGGRDQLCCGSMGRVELLLIAGRELDRPDLVEEAGRRAALVVARAEQTGGYALMAGLPRGVSSPGLFQGTAGIGYQLLRLARPDVVPSVLRWD
ncbi:MAG: type 2 lanthipeptide synthetase LanM family protein [Lapillicoccus sp.]